MKKDKEEDLFLPKVYIFLLDKEKHMKALLFIFK